MIQHFQAVRGRGVEICCGMGMFGAKLNVVGWRFWRARRIERTVYDRAVPQVATIVPRVLRDTSLVSRVASSSMTVDDLKSAARDV